MDIFSTNSSKFIIQKGWFLNDERKYEIEIIKNPAKNMSEEERIKLLEAITALYKKRNWIISKKSLMFSIIKATCAILLKDHEGLAGTLFSGQRTTRQGMKFYYIEKMIIKENVPFKLILLLLSVMLQNVPSYLKEEIIVMAIGRIKIIDKLLSLFGKGIGVSNKERKNLIKDEKNLVMEMVSSVFRGYINEDMSIKIEKNIIKNVFDEEFNHDGSNALISKNDNLHTNDAFIFMYKYGKNIEEMREAFNQNDLRKKMYTKIL